MQNNHNSLLVFILWFLGAFFFFCEYFLRVSPSVMLPNLAEKFSINAMGLGTLSAFFYYPYICMQIPVGLITDKFGPQKVMVIAAFLTGIACLLFALSDSFTWALISRMLMGFCGAFAFVGTLRIAINFFTPRIFSVLTGITQAIGMLGAVVGEAPMSLYTGIVGVKASMLSFCLLFFILTILIGIITQKTTHYKNSKVAFNRPSFNILSVMKNMLNLKALLLNCLFIGFLYGPTMVFAEMWGTTFTKSYRVLFETEAAFTVSFIFLGMVFGCVLFGILNSNLKALSLMRFSAIASLVLISIIIYMPSLDMLELKMLYFSYGICNAGIIPSYHRSALLVPKEFSGIALGVTNMFSVLLGTIYIQLVGLLISIIETGNATEHSMHSPFLYQKIFVILLASFTICLVLSCFMKHLKKS